MTKRKLVIATRKSPLALAQTAFVSQALTAIDPQCAIEVLGLSTTGDEHLSQAIALIGGKGIFVKELDDALLSGRADIAVHSFKDVPMDLAPGLVIPSVLKRGEVRDVFIANQASSLLTLATGARIGTSSLRRQYQLHRLRSDVGFEPLRGNIQTRLDKLDRGEYAAIVLAGAGLSRLNLDQRITSYFSVEEILPAAGQGAIAIACRDNDLRVQEALSQINDPHTLSCVTAERALCRRLNGGCSIPLAAYAKIKDHTLTITGRLVDKRGIQDICCHRSGRPEEAEALGIRVAEEMLSLGAEKILLDCRQ